MWIHLITGLAVLHFFSLFPDHFIISEPRDEQKTWKTNIQYQPVHFRFGTGMEPVSHRILRVFFSPTWSKHPIIHAQKNYKRLTYCVNCRSSQKPKNLNPTLKFEIKISKVWPNLDKCRRMLLVPETWKAANLFSILFMFEECSDTADFLISFIS